MPSGRAELIRYAMDHGVACDQPPDQGPAADPKRDIETVDACAATGDRAMLDPIALPVYRPRSRVAARFWLAFVLAVVLAAVVVILIVG